MAKKKAFQLRIQPELWEDVSRWAADELRSVNGHIEYLLRQAVRERGKEAAPSRRRRRDDEGSGS